MEIRGIFNINVGRSNHTKGILSQQVQEMETHFKEIILKWI